MKNPPVNAEIAGDTDSVPTSGRFPWSRKGQPLRYSCLGNPMDRGAWGAMVKRLQRVRHNWVTKHKRAFCCQQRMGFQDTPHLASTFHLFIPTTLVGTEQPYCSSTSPFSNQEQKLLNACKGQSDRTRHTEQRQRSSPVALKQSHVASSSPGELWRCLVVTAGQDSRHLVDRGQGCCQTRHNAWDSFPELRVIWPKQ